MYTPRSREEQVFMSMLLRSPTCAYGGAMQLRTHFSLDQKSYVIGVTCPTCRKEKTFRLLSGSGAEIAPPFSPRKVRVLSKLFRRWWDRHAAQEVPAS